MRIRTCILSLIFILALCMVCAISTATADITSVTDLGDGSAEVRWDSNDDTQLHFIRKTGEDFESDLNNYGYFWIPTEEGKNRMTVYIMAPGQSYWVRTMNSGSGFTTPWAYNVGRAPNFSEFSHPPKFSLFELKTKNSAGKMTDTDYFLASDLENENNYDSYGIRFRVTWPDLAKPRTYLWQFVLQLPDGERFVQYHKIVNMPVGGYFWRSDYTALENDFYRINNMRREVPVGQYKWSLYWNGQHVASCDFWVR